ncbi:MAG: hypothetical protein AB1700_19130, partial [Bacillota bacterium]
MSQRVACALGIDESQAYFDYFGLNHLGWLRAVYAHGDEVLASALARLDEPAIRRRMAAVDEIAMFGADLVRELRMIPNEYLYYYYHNREAVENIRSAGETRGQFLLRTARDLMGRLKAARSAGDPAEGIEEYVRFMETRHRMYMKTETGAGRTQGHESHGTGATGGLADGGEDGGYERIALGVIKAIAHNLRQVMVLNTRSRGAIEGLAADRVAELPCVVDASGVRPLAVGAVPGEALGLMQMVSEYERLTIEASVTGSYHTAWRALTVHPLVPSAELARQILDEYLSQHGAALEHVRRRA